MASNNTKDLSVRIINQLLFINQKKYLMKKLVCLFLSLLFSAFTFNAFNQTTTNEFNLGFEKTRFGKQLPNNWYQWDQDYILKIDTVIKHSGKNSILIESPAERKRNTLGCIAYSIPAIYSGKEIEVKAYMKLENVTDGIIGLILRIDGESKLLEYDNMKSKGVKGTSDWTQYSVKLKYPDKAKNIIIGALLSGNGKLWVDDFEVLIDGKDISEAKLKKESRYKAPNDKEFDKGSNITAINLDETKIDNLYVLGKVWGFLKYYHPAIAKGDYNWDYELFRIMPKIIDAKDKNERNNILSAWVDNLGKIDKIKVIDDFGKDVKFAPDLAWINNSILGDKLTAQLIRVKNAKRKNENYYVDLYKGIRNAGFENEETYMSMKYPDAGFRLLSLYRYWNIINYYFPYKNLIEENWNDVLKEYIPKFINASNELEYLLTTQSLIARIHDTHANIWSYHETLNKYKGVNYAPVEVTFVENKAVVTDYYDKVLSEKSGLKKGDVIVSINGKSVEDIIKDKLPLTPASNYPTQLRDIASGLLRTNDSVLNITYKRNNISKTIPIECYSNDKVNIYSKYYKKDTCFKLITPDIAYFYPGSIKSKYLEQIYTEISKTKGLIIDFRSYPSDNFLFSLGKFLLPHNIDFVKFTSGSILSPGLFKITMTESIGEKNKYYYKGKVIILVNETTQSSAEFHTMAFRIAPQAKVIGSTTAGADGNVSQIFLPGGIKTMMSGIGVYYPDGKETQRIGIVPDIDIKPTIKGITEGKDEVLDKAIELINGK